MVAWGVFNDEGQLDADLREPDALESAQQYRDRFAADEDNGDPHAYAAEQCPDHEGEPRDTCEECDTDDDEDELDELDDDEEA